MSPREINIIKFTLNKKRENDTLKRYPFMVSMVPDVPGLLDSGRLGCRCCTLPFFFPISEGKHLGFAELLLVDPDTYCCYYLIKLGLLDKNL